MDPGLFYLFLIILVPKLNFVLSTVVTYQNLNCSQLVKWQTHEKKNKYFLTRAGLNVSYKL